MVVVVAVVALSACTGKVNLQGLPRMLNWQASKSLCRSCAVYICMFPQPKALRVETALDMKFLST